MDLTQIKTIAHRYGNNFQDLQKALISEGVDAIECDIWWDGGSRFSVHHNRKYWFFPLIGFERWKGLIRFVFAWTVPGLEEILEKTARNKPLVLNIKGAYSEEEREVLYTNLFILLAARKSLHTVVLDPQNTHLHIEAIQTAARIVHIAPPPIRFSIGTKKELQEFFSLGRRDLRPIAGVVIKKSILCTEQLQPMRTRRLHLPVWVYTINKLDEALYLAQSNCGIVSDRLELLEEVSRKN